VLIIAGIGGIGKTALADAVTRGIIQYFQFPEVLWLRLNLQPTNNQYQPDIFTAEDLMATLALHLCPHMPPETSPRQRNFQIRQLLKTTPHFIVIDNVETKIETAVLDLLVDLANPGKFLLTSRTQPPQHSGVYGYRLTELKAIEVSQFVRYHAQEVGLTEIANAKEEDIQLIYDVVGGNPLALKLVVSLASVLPLAQILDDLTQVNIAQVETLYRHIYWQAWQTLHEESQLLLMAMPLTTDMGSQPDHLMMISSLEEKSFWTAVSELTARSLLEVRGTTRDRYYGIHRLTESFLKTEIIHWPE
jgi:hypothetical protein